MARKGIKRRFPIGKVIDVLNPETGDYEKVEVVGWWSDGFISSSNYSEGVRGIYIESTHKEYAESALNVKQRHAVQIVMWQIDQ